MSLGLNGSSAGGGALNLETGSYVGDGTSPKTLTFKGTPIFVAIRCMRDDYLQSDNMIFNAYGYNDVTDRLYPAMTSFGGSSLSNQTQISVSDKTLKMTPYNSTGSRFRYIFNESGKTYYWFAITV